MENTKIETTEIDSKPRWEKRGHINDITDFYQKKYQANIYIRIHLDKISIIQNTSKFEER